MELRRSLLFSPFYKDVAHRELCSATVSWLFVALSATIKQSQAQRADIFVALRTTAKSKSPSGAKHLIIRLWNVSLLWSFGGIIAPSILQRCRSQGAQKELGTFGFQKNIAQRTLMEYLQFSQKRPSGPTSL